MRKILLAIAIFVVLLCVWLFYKPQQSTVSADIPPAFQALLDAKLDQVTKLKLEKGKGPPVELVKAGGKWVVSTAYGYPADGEKAATVLGYRTRRTIEEAMVEVCDAIKAGRISGDSSNFNLRRYKELVEAR